MNPFRYDQDSPASSKSVAVCAFYTVVLLLAVISFSQPVQAANSLSQNDITWTFDKDYQSGQFVNGEWWVVGPVTVTDISPKDTNLADDIDMHGSMINPYKNLQGWDNRGASATRYKRELNIARQLPYTVQPGSSLMSCVSKAAYDDGYISKGAILTVLAGPPPAGSFRPSYYGSDKTLYNERALNYSIFRNLKPTPNAPTPQSLANGNMKHFIIDLYTGGARANTEFKTLDLAPPYGREIAKNSAAAALALNLNYSNTEKRDLLVEVVQRGIDLYGSLIGGYNFTPDGGHNHGRKLTMYIAAKSLGHSHMLSLCDGASNQAFQEDLQHDFVNAAWTNYPAETYGTPEWTTQAFQKLDRPVNDWEAPYRFTNGCGNIGTVLAVTLMGGRAEWNHEALFRYIIERYWPIESLSPVANRSVGSTNGIPTFTYEMWNAYFDDGDVLDDSLPVAPDGVEITRVPE